MVTEYYRADTISLQAAVHPGYTLGALNMIEEEEQEISASMLGRSKLVRFFTRGTSIKQIFCGNNLRFKII